MKLNRTAIGRKGEELARRFFKARKDNIVARNFRTRYGEIDLILRRDRAFRFVEVKYRRSRDYGSPQSSVVRYKQQRIRKTAIYWLQLRHLPLDSEMHFDVLAIDEEGGKVKYEYIEDAF